MLSVMLVKKDEHDQEHIRAYGHAFDFTKHAFGDIFRYGHAEMAGNDTENP